MSELGRRLVEERARQRWGRLNRDRWRAVLKHGGSSVLDVGCSSGGYVRELAAAGRTASGTDLLLDPAWTSLPGAFRVADVRALPFADDAFDTLLAFEILEHVPGPGAALRELHRVCRENLILSVPNCEIPEILRSSGLAFHHWVDRTHVNFFTRQSITEYLRQAGFRTVDLRLINPIAPAAPALHALGIPFGLSVFLGGVFRAISPRRYRMTLPIVADKVVSA